MAVAHVECIVQFQDVSAMSNGEKPSSQENAASLDFDVDTKLSKMRRAELLAQLDESLHCSAMPSEVGRTTVAKHGIFTDGATRPTCQPPYLVSPNERGTIRNQVRGMLKGDVIQPSYSP